MKLIALLTIGCIVLGFICLKMVTPLYTVTAKVLVHRTDLDAARTGSGEGELSGQREIVHLHASPRCRGWERPGVREIKPLRHRKW